MFFACFQYFLAFYYCKYEKSTKQYQSIRKMDHSQMETYFLQVYDRYDAEKAAAANETKLPDMKGTGYGRLGSSAHRN